MIMISVFVIDLCFCFVSFFVFASYLSLFLLYFCSVIALFLLCYCFIFALFVLLFFLSFLHSLGLVYSIISCLALYSIYSSFAVLISSVTALDHLCFSWGVDSFLLFRLCQY